MRRYAILKPLRDEMGIAGGVDNLPHLYLVTLGAMLVAAALFGWLSRGRRRGRRLPAGDLPVLRVEPRSRFTCC